MKSWRNIAAVAMLAMSPAAAVLAGGKCVPDLRPTCAFPLVMCVERDGTTNANLGNGFPWENNTTFFAAYRNQYLYPSKTLAATANVSNTIETMHSRAVSFSGASTNVYGSTLADNFIRVGKGNATLARQFNLNNLDSGAYMNCVGPKTITHTNGVKLSNLNGDAGSTGCPKGVGFGCGNTANELTTFIDCNSNTKCTAGGDNILVDSLMRVGGAGNSGNGVWDVTEGACSDPRRAYGSGLFVNPNALTTAYGVDGAAFVWVFRGIALPPPSTVQQQIAEVIRLLITPQGLRCAGLDLTPDGRLRENPLNFPDGKDYDAISPQVTNDGIKTGEEAGDGSSRKQGWKP